MTDMTETAQSGAVNRNADGGGQGRRTYIRRFFRRENRHVFILSGILLLSFGIDFFAISKVGYGNAYYAAAIKSMTQSFRNFFYVSFDPAGLVSVDKPPLGLWIQALFVLVFGYHGWAMLLPQALAGTASCFMMYLLTAKYYGRPAGYTASLVFALTPAVAVAARNNTMDMQLIFTLLAAAWFLFRAIERRKWRFLFLAALFVGLGFNIKMLEAYMVLPAMALIYLVFSKEKLLKRILAGFLSILIVTAVSFVWVFAVELTPAANRPYVGSSTDNSELELIIGHNGLERLYGFKSGGMGGRGGNGGGNMQNGGPGGNFGNGGSGGQGGNSGGGFRGGSAQNGNTQQGNASAGKTGSFRGSTGGNSGGGFGFGGQGGGRGGSGGVNGNDIGSEGLLRMWSKSDYGQASWLIVFALFGFAAALRKKHGKALPLKLGVALFWLLWLVTMLAFFSFASFWHRYYLCILAPGVAGLSGIGLSQMAGAFRMRRGWRRFLLPAAFAATLAVELLFIWKYPAQRAYLVPVMALSGAPALLLLALRIARPRLAAPAGRFRPGRRAAAAAACGLMLVSLLAAPFYWSLTTILYVSSNITMPYAGPELGSAETVITSTPNQEAYVTSDKGMLSLEKYLAAHYKKGSYLVASLRANDVAQFIIDTGLPAVAFGGFQGTDSVLSLDQFKSLVKSGKITYVFVSGQSGMMRSDSEILSYVEQNAKLVEASDYGDASVKVGQVGGKLYRFSD